ncbi:MAG: Dabb family protein [Bacteroidota bacterium]
MSLRKISIYFPIFALIALMASCNQKVAENKVNIEAKPVVEKTEKDSVLRHVVLFKFNEDATEAAVEKLNAAFNALPEVIPEIKAFEWGINDSPEDFHQGFTHCYLLTFDSVKDRDSIYAPHPAHKAFGDSLQPHLEKVFVVDYWTQP